MIFKGSKEETENKSTLWLKVKDVDDIDNFVIKDEIKSGRSKFEQEGDASGLIERKNDGVLFMKKFKAIELENLARAFGEDSSKWIGREIEIKMLVSKKWNKPFLAVNPILDLEEPF